ncbi:MAG: DoxX family protein [Terriglobales bacterium]
MLGDFCNHFRPLALTLLRLALGIIFLWHGTAKVSDLAHWTQNFVHMGFPSYFAYIAGGLETIGGALLILGLWGRLAGLLLAGELLIAVLKVHLPGGPLWNVGRYELQMLLSGASFVIFAYGSGPWSLDAAVFGRRGGGKARRSAG